MGGWGSGRQEYATTPTVGQCEQLDSDGMAGFTESAGLKGKIWWGEKDDPNMVMGVRSEGSSSVAVERPSRLRLVYHAKDANTGEVTNEFDYHVGLDYTECHFGGYRVWFNCPDCSDRVGKLYMTPRGYRFSCRECLGLGYESSRASGTNLRVHELRYRRAFAKADKNNRRPHPGGITPLPEKPKGMHESTFEELRADVIGASCRWSSAMIEEEKKLLGSLTG